jgi:hypothetical protein
VCFDDHQKYFGISDGIVNLLEHHLLSKEQFFVLEGEMSNGDALTIK